LSHKSRRVVSRGIEGDNRRLLAGGGPSLSVIEASNRGLGEPAEEWSERGGVGSPNSLGGEGVRERTLRLSDIASEDRS